MRPCHAVPFLNSYLLVAQPERLGRVSKPKAGRDANREAALKSETGPVPSALTPAAAPSMSRRDTIPATCKRGERENDGEGGKEGVWG